MATPARDSAGNCFEPLNIKSAPDFDRRDFIDCSPRTKRNASTTLLFPDPFGPTTAVTFEPKEKLCFLANDLNPLISIDFSVINSILMFLLKFSK